MGERGTGVIDLQEDAVRHGLAYGEVKLEVPLGTYRVDHSLALLVGIGAAPIELEVVERSGKGLLYNGVDAASAAALVQRLLHLDGIALGGLHDGGSEGDGTDLVH